jgi:CubicO group peptidase (beta-lactamase class C family)
LSSVLINNAVFSQVSSTQIDHLVADAMKKFNVTGVAVGIVHNGQIIHNKGYGLKSIDSDEKVNEHTKFAIASNSKAFTATALAILIEEGKLSWKDKVKDHIPEFKMYNDYVTENFTITDLITHRSGLGLGIGDLMFIPDGGNFTIKDVLSSFQHFKPQSAFRTKFDYDNLLYFVAGEVTARVSGMSWEAFVEKRILQPLEMDNSFSSVSMLKDKNNLASPHSAEKGSLKKLQMFEEMVNGAAGGIYSNVDDLCNWMLVHLNKGRYGKNLEKKLFSDASRREMWKIHTTLDANPNPRYNSHFSGYGLGWFLGDMNGNMTVSHGGELPGMVSQTLLIPDLNLGLVILTNSSSGSGLVYGVIQMIIDSYMALDEYDWIDHYHKHFLSQQNNADAINTKVWETVKSNKKIKILPDDYIGIFEDKWFGKIEIFKKNDKLWFKSYRSPKLNGEMYYYKSNAFAIKWEYQDMNADAFAIFSMDEEGKAQSIKMKGISPNIDFSFDFQDLDLHRIHIDKQASSLLK